MRKYIKIWWKMMINSAQIAFASRFGAVLFVFGKLMRFALFLLFIFLIEQRTKTVGGYTLWQMVFFFATFNIVDLVPQFFLREVYRFRSHVVSGEFDYILVKPISPLFRSLFGGSDVLDIVLLVINGCMLYISLQHIGSITIVGVILYCALLANALLLALSFHIMILGIGIMSTAVDNTLWMYRDLTRMGQIPITLYLEPVRGFITFIVPVGIMMTFPPQALLGILSGQAIGIAFGIGALFFIASLKFWNYSLKSYTSASS